MTSIFDYLNEDDNRESLFQRAKRMALSLARRNNRSTTSIQNTDSAGDLRQRISSWENSSDPKVKAAYNNIMNVLRNKAGKSNDSENSNSSNNSQDQNDTDNQERQDNQNTSDSNRENSENNQDNSQDNSQENRQDTENLDPQSAENVEYAREQERQDIEKYSKQIIDNENKKLETAKGISNILASLLDLIAPDSKGKPDMSSVENRVKNKVEMVSNITNTITSIKDQYDAMEDDYKTKVEAQDKWLKDKELEINSKNSPEIDRILKDEKQSIDREITSKIAEENLSNDYNDYKNLLANIQYLNDDQRQRLESYQNGRIGQIVNDANRNNQRMSQSEIDRINRQYRQSELSRIREKAKKNKKDLKNRYDFEMKNFDNATKDTMNYLEKYKNALAKNETFSAKDNENLTNSLKYCSDSMKNIVGEYSKFNVNNSDEDNNSQRNNQRNSQRNN